MAQQDQASKISGMMIDPVGAETSPDGTHGSTPRSVDQPLRAGLEDEVPKVKDSQPRRPSASPQKRAPRTSLGNKHGAVHSPPHHHHQARVARKVSSASNTPTRLRLQVGGRADESPWKRWVVPKFGGWNKPKPSSAYNFTGTFDQVRKEREAIAKKIPIITDDSHYLDNYHHENEKGSKRSTIYCCFNWGKK